MNTTIWGFVFDGKLVALRENRSEVEAFKIHHDNLNIISNSDYPSGIVEITMRMV